MRAALGRHAGHDEGTPAQSTSAKPSDPGAARPDQEPT